MAERESGEKVDYQMSDCNGNHNTILSCHTITPYYHTILSCHTILYITHSSSCRKRQAQLGMNRVREGRQSTILSQGNLYNTIQYNKKQYNTIQYNTTGGFFSNAFVSTNLTLEEISVKDKTEADAFYASLPAVCMVWYGMVLQYNYRSIA